MEAPLVTVVIPVYNGGNYLRQAIDSVLAQTYTSIEIIVVNDGSTDDGLTDEIARSYGELIRYYNKENGGVATALNFAISKMNGTYFSWLSHDDMYYSNKIERQLAALNMQGNVHSIVYSNYDLLNVATNQMDRVELHRRYSLDQLENSVFPVLQGLIHGCSLLIHRSHFDRVGIFDPSLVTTQDYELWFRMFRYERLLYIADSLIVSRVHQLQGSRTIESHNQEKNELHVRFIESLAKEEMISLYGSPYNLYYRLGCVFQERKMEDAYYFVHNKLRETPIPEGILEQNQFLHSYINALSEGRADQLCIFGAGIYGLRLYKELRCRNVKVVYFADNNPGKWRQLIEQIPCISPNDLKSEKDRTLVVVATRSAEEIVNQLESFEFPYITTKQKLDIVLSKIPPILREYSDNKE